LHSPRNSLHQFLTVGLHPLCLMFSLMVIELNETYRAKR
jgi:hypothetical protein